MVWIQWDTLFAAIVELRIFRESLIDYAYHAKSCLTFASLFNLVMDKVYILRSEYEKKQDIGGNGSCLTLKQYFDIFLKAIRSYSKPTSKKGVFQLDPDKFRGYDKVKSMIENANRSCAQVKEVNIDCMMEFYSLGGNKCFNGIERNLEDYFTENFAQELLRELNRERGENPKDVDDSQSNFIEKLKKEIKNSPSNPLNVMFAPDVALVKKLLVIIVASVFDRRGPEKYGKKIVGCRAFDRCEKENINCWDFIQSYSFSYILPLLLLCPKCSDFYIEFIDNPEQGLAYKFNGLINLVWTAVRNLTVELYFPHKMEEVTRKYVICIGKNAFESLKNREFPSKLEETPFTKKCLLNKDKSEGEDKGGGKSGGMGKGGNKAQGKDRNKRYQRHPENVTEISVGGIAEVEEADKYSKIPDENSNLNEDEMGDEE